MKAVIQQQVLEQGFCLQLNPHQEMLLVYDKPIIQYAIEEAVVSGIDDILIVTGRHKKSIEDYFDKSYELEQTLQNLGKG